MQRVLHQPGLTRSQRNEKLRSLYRDRQRDLSSLLTERNIQAVRQRFDQKDAASGLSLAEFVNVMDRCLGHFVLHKLDFIMQLVELFHQVDANDNQLLEWDEFSTHVVEMGSSSPTDAATYFATRFVYTLCSEADRVTHVTPVAKSFPSLSIDPNKPPYITSWDARSSSVRWYRTVDRHHALSLLPQKTFRHDTGYTPHQVLAATHVAGFRLLVTSSQESRAGPYWLSFFDEDSAALVARVAVQVAQHCVTYSESAETLFFAGPDSRAIQGYSPRTFEKRKRLPASDSPVQCMEAVPGYFSLLLLTGHTDGCMRVFDLRSCSVIQHLTIQAHPLGVMQMKIAARLNMLVTVGFPYSTRRPSPRSYASVHVWPLDKWIGGVKSRLEATHKKEMDRRAGRGQQGRPRGRGEEEEGGGVSGPLDDQPSKEGGETEGRHGRDTDQDTKEKRTPEQLRTGAGEESEEERKKDPRMEPSALRARAKAQAGAGGWSGDAKWCREQARIQLLLSNTASNHTRKLTDEAENDDDRGDGMDVSDPKSPTEDGEAGITGGRRAGGSTMEGGGDTAQLH